MSDPLMNEPFNEHGSAAAESLAIGTVRHVAKLARLRLSDQETERYRGQLTSILGHISKLSAVDVAGVEPMAHPLAMTNRFGADEPAAAMSLDALLMNAPAVEGRLLAVPKVLGEGS